MAGKSEVKVCLIVIDGWGLSEERIGNAILNASTPVMTDLSRDKRRFTTLDASGLSVGLPPDLMGNSEVGHLNIGAGRVVFQDIVRINLDTKKKKLQVNPQFVKACDNAKKNGGRLHLVGLVSDGGVHSHMDHLFSLLEGAKAAQVPQTFVHFIADGRDTSPTSGAKYLKQLLDFMSSLEYGELGTVVGRYYAMDRDKRWERIKTAYDGLVLGVGKTVKNSQAALQLVEKRYASGEKNGRQTDEFLTPIIVRGVSRIQDNDTVVFFNYRSDRMREIVETFAYEIHFETDVVRKNLYVLCMTQYNPAWTLPLMYHPSNTQNTLSEWLSHKKVRQFHCAETEKYAHVTFFFNGGKEEPVELEERCMVPSPKVSTYDLKPEMSADGVADKMVEAMESGNYRFVMCNFAPPDMIGHTGVYDAAVKAVTATDAAIGRVFEGCKNTGFVLFVTSAHGNAERMVAVNGTPHTAHTTNRVPLVMANTDRTFVQTPISNDFNPALCNVATTVLDIMDLGKPEEMTGRSLLEPTATPSSSGTFGKSFSSVVSCLPEMQSRQELLHENSKLRNQVACINAAKEDIITVEQLWRKATYFRGSLIFLLYYKDVPPFKRRDPVAPHPAHRDYAARINRASASFEQFKTEFLTRARWNSQDVTLNFLRNPGCLTACVKWANEAIHAAENFAFDQNQKLQRADFPTYGTDRYSYNECCTLVDEAIADFSKFNYTSAHFKNFKGP